ncbi:MAG: Sec-independent protein translocase TatC [Candidatus Thermoplasmatota archaeon]|jgi:sec-independent protein translocase protein TatC|nr:Sec-independent protein translocase TatC [Candidatus Thermoplasmatota archaeon]MCL5988622.1 Sec-independent protein translocase TatC [Candidatus Thermoplasmatota archaeon]
MEDGLLKIIFDNIDDLRKTVTRIAIPIIVLFCIFLMADVRTITAFGTTFWILYPDPYQNVGAQFLTIMEVHTIGNKFTLLAIKPTDGVVADFYSVMFLALILTSPFTSFEISKFVGPALKANEKQLFRMITVPSVILFIAGSLIALVYVAPLMFDILYSFDIGVGANATMSINYFISFLLIYVLSFGLAFETPVIMVGLTYMGLVKAQTWKLGWRYAVVAALVFGLVFSPGVTGITMMLLAIPIIILYFAGIVVSSRVEKKRNGLQSTVTEK